MPKRKRVSKAQAPAQWRSGFERRIREDLDRREITYTYESHQFPVTLDIPGCFCEACGDRRIKRVTRYTPDFYFYHPSDGKPLIVEAKGKFDAKARKLALAFKRQYGYKYEYRLLFQRDNWMTKEKKQRYSDWCATHNILCHVGRTVPNEWIPA